VSGPAATAVVEDLWRFPVKSFQGERVERVDVERSGIVGDRRYAVVDLVRGAAISAKTEPRLLSAWARTEGAEVIITLPDGNEVEAGSAEAPDVVSNWLGREVGVAEATASGEGRARAGDLVPSGYWMTLDPPNDAAEQYEIPMPEGTFFDLYQLHVVTSASLARCREARPDLMWDVRRFRPNVVVADDGPGFPEDAWVDHRVAIGAATIGVVMRTMRCAMPLRPQPERDGLELERSTDIYRTMDAIHANDLGVYCSVLQGGVVAVGDRVEVLSV
jgi:uncharacterized protein YcbX